MFLDDVPGKGNCPKVRWIRVYTFVRNYLVSAHQTRLDIVSLWKGFLSCSFDQLIVYNDAEDAIVR